MAPWGEFTADRDEQAQKSRRIRTHRSQDRPLLGAGLCHFALKSGGLWITVMLGGLQPTSIKPRKILSYSRRAAHRTTQQENVGAMIGLIELTGGERLGSIWCMNDFPGVFVAENSTEFLQLQLLGQPRIGGSLVDAWMRLESTCLEAWGVAQERRKTRNRS